MKNVRLAAVAAFLALPAMAEAHVGIHESGLASGFVHPFTGIDHLLAMLAVGLWAAQIGGRARFIVPLSFMAMMAVGGTLGMSGLHFGLLETLVAASVAALGLAVAFGWKIPVPLASALVGTAALLHGMAHGSELPAMAGPVTFVAGFVAATGLIHAAGVGLGMIRAGRAGEIAVRIAGGAVSLAGLALLGA